MTPRVQASGFDGLAHAAGVIDGVDGAHVIAMAVLFLAAVGQAHAQRGAEQRGFDIVHAQRIAAEQGLHQAAADQRRETGDAAGMHHHRTRHHDHLLPLLHASAASARRSGARRSPPAARTKCRWT